MPRETDLLRVKLVAHTLLDVQMGGDEDSEISIWERAVKDTADKLLYSAVGPCHRAGYPACGK